MEESTMEASALNNLSAFFELAKVLPEAALLLSGRGEILAANPPAAAMLGLGAPELRGTSLYDLTIEPPEDVDHHLKAWSRTRTLIPGSLTWKAADGQVIDCRCDGAIVRPPTEDSAAVIFLRCVPKAVSNSRFLALNEELEALRNEHRRVSQINAHLEERVEERTAQLARSTEKLRESRAWFRSIVKNTSDIVWIARADGTLSYVSPSVERVLGYKPEDLVDTYGFDLVHLDDAARSQGFYDEVLERPGAIPSVEFRLRRSDGSWCHTESTGSNLLQDPSVSGVVFNSRDITERKQAEEESNLLRTLALEIGKAEDLDSALGVVLHRVCEATGWAIGQARIPSDDRTVLVCSEAWYTTAENGAKNSTEFRVANEEYVFEPGEGLPGYTWSRKQPTWTRDITQSSFTRAPLAAEFGLKAAMDIPVIADSEVVAVLDFFVFEEREEDERLIEIVSGVRCPAWLSCSAQEGRGRVARERRAIPTPGGAGRGRALRSRPPGQVRQRKPAGVRKPGVYARGTAEPLGNGHRGELPPRRNNEAMGTGSRRRPSHA
jgi:PAS domain S-box-containing protein